MIRMSLAEWTARATELFGEDPMQWRFVCPSCKHVASVVEWRDAGATEGAVAFSCVGRWTNADDTHTFKGQGGPCTYAGGGLIGLNPITVVMPDNKERAVFAFAEKSLSVDLLEGG